MPGITFEHISVLQDLIDNRPSDGITLDLEGRHFITITDRSGVAMSDSEIGYLNVQKDLTIQNGNFYGGFRPNWIESDLGDGIYEAPFDFTLDGTPVSTTRRFLWTPNEKSPKLSIYPESVFDKDAEGNSGDNKYYDDYGFGRTERIKITQNLSLDGEFGPNTEVNGYLSDINGIRIVAPEIDTDKDGINDSLDQDVINNMDPIKFITITNSDVLNDIKTYFSISGTINYTFYLNAVTYNNVAVIIPISEFNTDTGVLTIEDGSELNPVWYFATDGYLGIAFTGLKTSLKPGQWFMSAEDQKIYWKPRTGSPSGDEVLGISSYIFNLPPTDSVYTYPDTVDNRSNGSRLITFENCTFNVCGGTSIRASSGSLCGLFYLKNCSFTYANNGISRAIAKVEECYFDQHLGAGSNFADGSILRKNYFGQAYDKSCFNVSCTITTDPPSKPLLTTIEQNFFYNPSTQHGQGCSIYEKSFYNVIIKNNIALNVQRFFTCGCGGNTVNLVNELIADNNLVYWDDYIPTTQHFFSFWCQELSPESGNNGTYIPGEFKAYIRNNTGYSGKQDSFHMHFYIGGNNTEIHGNIQYGLANNIISRINQGDITNGTTLVASAQRNNFMHYQNGYPGDPANTYYAGYSKEDLPSPEFGDLDTLYNYCFDPDTLQPLELLQNAATDGGRVGVRWSDIPTVEELYRIRDREEGYTAWWDLFVPEDIPSADLDFTDATTFDPDTYAGSNTQLTTGNRDLREQQFIEFTNTGYTAELVYGITHTNFDGVDQYDEYVWTVISGATIEHGTFLDGTPWVVDNGTLQLYSVTPTEQEITTTAGTGLVNRTVINPDFGKILRDPAKSGISFGDSASHVRCTDDSDFDTIILHPFDFRAGTGWGGGNLGTGYDDSQGISLSSPILLGVGDMVMTQTAYTGDIGDYINPFTESYGCFSVVQTTPPENAFRPPINWDPTDKVNRPIFTEGDTFGNDEFTIPNYYISSDDAGAGFSEGLIYSSGLLNRLGTICPSYYGTDPSGLSGTLKNQAQTESEYGGVQARSEEQMAVSCFHPDVTEEIKTSLRRTLAQRGIDTFGAMYSLGKNVGPNGYHNGEYQPRVYFAWAVCGDSRMYDVLNYKIGNAQNSTYKEFSPLDIYGGSNCYHETGQAFTTTNVCSFRHFNIPIVEWDAGSDRWIRISRPERMSTLNESDRAPIPLTGSGYSRWGWGNNGGVPSSEIIGAYIRLKSINGNVEITRIIDAEPEIGTGTEADPEFFKLYLQENILTGLESSCDLSSSLVETRNTKGLIRNITYEYSNTSSETSTISYDYSVISHILSNHLLSKAKGGRSSVPGWAQEQWDKAIRLTSTNEGKYILVKGNNTSYNLGSSSQYQTPKYQTDGDLYFALCRQEIADGLLLNPFPEENGRDRRDPANWYSFPASRTWEELDYPSGNIIYYSKGLNSVNNPAPLYYYSNNQEFISTKWFLHETDVNGNKKIILDCTASGSGCPWGDLSDYKAYVWPSGMTYPIGLSFESSSAADGADTTWRATWVFDDEYKNIVPQSVKPSYAGTSVFFVDPQTQQGNNFLVFDEEVSGSVYMSVWDGTQWEVYKSNSTTGLTKEFFDYRSSGGTAEENEIFVISRQDPGDPTQFNPYPPEPTYGTFSDLKSLISKTTGVLDLNGSTYEAESSDLDITDLSRYGCPVLTSSIHTIKNGTIIAGRKASWSDIGNGLYRAPLTSDEFSILGLDPRAHLYDDNAEQIPSMATYPVPPDTMLPRNSMSFNSNWWSLTAWQSTPAVGYVYTQGRILTLDGNFPPDGSTELENLFDFGGDVQPMVYADGTNETNSLSKGQISKWISSTKQVHVRDIWYRESTSDEFIRDRRAWDNHPNYPNFNVGDVITDRDTGNQFTITESTNINAKYGEIYGFRITDPTFLAEYSDYVSDMGLDYFVFIHSGANTVGVLIPHSWDSTTGELIFQNGRNMAYSGAYAEFALSGNEKIVSNFPYASYSIDYANQAYIYKPANGDPSGAYLPIMPRALYLNNGSNGITMENMTIISGCNAGTTPSAIRETGYLGQLTMLNCLFKQTLYAVRLTNDTPAIIKNNIFRDTYERCFSGLADGSIVERNIFDNTETRSVLFLSAEPRGEGSETIPVRTTVIKDNVFYLPASNHGQGISLYINSWHNALIEHNIFYNCQRAHSMQPQDLPFRTVGGVYKFQNNLLINDNFVDSLPGGQKTISFNGPPDTHIAEGEQKVYIRSNTLYTQEDLFTGDAFPTWRMDLESFRTSKVFIENNFCGGIGASPRDWEESNSSTPHKHRNNFHQRIGTVRGYGDGYSENDLYYPVDFEITDLFDFDTCSMTGDLKTAATDGGPLGIRWSVIPTRSQINQILTSGDINWADTYPADTIPETGDADENWGDAYFNEDLRIPSLSQPNPPTEYTVDVNIIDDNDYRFMLNGIQTPPISMIRGITYTFDQSLSSNVNFPFSISITADGNHGGGAGYTYGFSYTGTPGVDGVATFVPPADSPSILYYYCQPEAGMGGVIGITSA